MRIKCEAQVVNRKLAALAMKDKRPCKSSLGIVRNPGPKKDISCVFLHLCTMLNKTGTKYKVDGNIGAVFTKFIEKGKFTLRFKEPPVDLYVTTEPCLAKPFLQKLKSCLLGMDIDKIHLAKLEPIKKKQIDGLIHKMVITDKKDYPITKSFPHSLFLLRINKIGLKMIEDRIIQLKKLATLDLDCNLIKEIPRKLSQMIELSELILTNNKISFIHPDVFTGVLLKSLYKLDLSGNQLEALPTTLCNVKTLSILIADNNNLKSLPPQIGKIQTLSHLSAANNDMDSVPSTLCRLNLDFLDVSNNPFKYNYTPPKLNYTGGVHTLKDLAAKTCIRNNFMPTPADVPFTVVRYLQKWFMCHCGGPCLEEIYSAAKVPMDLRHLTNSVRMNNSYGTVVPAVMIFCSKKCCDKYKVLRKV